MYVHHPKLRKYRKECFELKMGITIAEKLSKEIQIHQIKSTTENTNTYSTKGKQNYISRASEAIDLVEESTTLLFKTSIILTIF